MKTTDNFFLNILKTVFFAALMTTLLMSAGSPIRVRAAIIKTGAEAEELLPEDGTQKALSNEERDALEISNYMSRRAKIIADREWKLRLVNPWNLLPSDFSVKLGNFKDFQMDKRAIDDAVRMFDAGKKAGLNFKIYSVYRSHETQYYAYWKKVNSLRSQGYGEEESLTVAATYTARPDTSEHQTGLAIDIVSDEYGAMAAPFANTKAYRWLSEHCYEYGFIMRYKEGRTETTGVIFEPWHYRYVGQPYAMQIKNFEGVFEEWLDEFNANSEACVIDKNAYVFQFSR